MGTIPKTLELKNEKPVLPRPALPAISLKVAPLERMFANPRHTYMVPRVAMKGVTPSFVMMRPFTTPKSTPMTRVTRTTTGTDM